MPVLTCVVEQLLGPVPGGTGRVTRELVSALAARPPAGWSVRTVCAWHRDITAAGLTAEAPGAARWPHRLPLGRRALAEAWSRGVPPWVRGDAVLATTPLAPLGPIGRRPTFVVVHDAVPFTHPDTLTARGARWHRTMIDRAARSAAGIIVPTQAVAAELDPVISRRTPVTVIGWGVGAGLAVPDDAAARRATLGLPVRYLLTVATAEPRKGLDVLVAALAADPDLPPLLVAGPAGWGGVDVAALARAAGLPAHRIRALGTLDEPDLAATLAAALLVAVPSRSEGFGLPVLEAMTAGVPVVHSDAPALVEVAGGAGVTAVRDDPAALGRALSSVLADPALRTRMVAAGRARAASFSWAGAAAQVWGLVSSAADQPPNR